MSGPIPIVLRPLDSIIVECQRGDTVLLEPERSSPLFIAGFVSSCARAEVIGIALGLRPEGGECCCAPKCGRGIAILRAHIEWSIGNACFEAEVDFLNGTHVAVVAENVRVCAEYKVWGSTGEGARKRCPACLPCYHVSAGFGYGAWGRNSNAARLTKRAETTVLEPIDTIKIPPFAISFTVLPIGTSQVNARVVARDCVTHVNYDIETPPISGCGHNVENAFPLFNGADTIQIVSKDGSPAQAFVIFGLAL